MSQYIGQHRSYFELVELFRTHMVDNPGTNNDMMKRKYFECLKLIADLKVSFEFYYDYKILRYLLKSYLDVLTGQLNQPKIQVFTPMDIVSNLNGYVYNTPSKNRSRSRQRFGEIQLNTSTIDKTNLFKDLQEERYNIKFQLKHYSLDGDNVIYNFRNTPFAGICTTKLLHNYYLLHIHASNYTRFQHNSERFQLFEIKPDYISFGINIKAKDGSLHLVNDVLYRKEIIEYLNKHNTCFTLIETGFPGHFVATLIHKNNNEINIFVIDSNNKESDHGHILKLELTRFFQKNQNTPCKGHYLVDRAYHLNFGGENHNIYESSGYCQLVGYVFMDILYRNIVFYNKLRYDAKPSDVIAFINNMKRYCHDSFLDRTNKHHELWKWKMICFNFSYRVMKSTNLFNTNPNRPLDQKYYQQNSVRDIITHKQNSQNAFFTFKQKLYDCFFYRGYTPNFFGINWQSNKDWKVVPQKDNDYYYFVPEQLDETVYDSDICYFSGINSDTIFKVSNSFAFAKVNSTDVNIDKVQFLFQNVLAFMEDVYKNKTPITLTDEDDTTPFTTTPVPPRPSSVDDTTTLPPSSSVDDTTPLPPSSPVDDTKPTPQRAPYIPPSNPLHHRYRYNQQYYNIINKHKKDVNAIKSFNPEKFEKHEKEIIASREAERRGNTKDVILSKRMSRYANHNFSHIINKQCSDAMTHRGSGWYERSYQLIKELHELVKLEILTPDYIYPRISHLANCIVNRHNWIMNVEEITKTSNELEFDLGNKIKKYMTDVEIKHFIEILKDLSAYKNFSSNRSSLEIERESKKRNSERIDKESDEKMKKKNTAPILSKPSVTNDDTSTPSDQHALTDLERARERLKKRWEEQKRKNASQH